MMEKKYARLAALLAAAVLCGNGAPSMAAWWEGTGAETITITADNYSQIQGDVYGNHDTIDTTNTVTGRVEMTGGTVTGRIYGGWAKEAAAVKNSTVTISGGTVGTVDRSRSVYGGYSESNSGEVSDNTVTITSGSTVTWSVYGGWSNGGAATGNTVKITGGTVTGYVYGGQSENGAVTDNTVTITGGEVNKYVYGGQSENGAVTDNTVTITDSGTVGGYVYGGQSENGPVTGNTVTITDSGTVGGDVYGVYGGYGGYSSSTSKVSDNTVTINGRTVKSSVYGGYSSSTSKVSDNTMTINGGTVRDSVYGGFSSRGAATGNTVTINGGEVTGDIFGDPVFTGVYGGFSNTGEVTDNTVTITGGSTVKNSVYGGYSPNNPTVSDNTVELLGSANVSEASLYGSNKAGTGNTLRINGWSGNTQSVKNFNEIQFQHLSWQKEPVLTIIGGGSSDLNGTTIAVEDGIALAGGQTFERGESMTLIHRKGGLGAITDLQEEKQIQLTAGVTTELAGTLSQETGDLHDVVLTIDSAQRSGQTDLVGENRAAGAAFVNQGADIAADSLRLLDDGYHFGMQTFGAVYGNRSTYDVASDIKINGWSEIAGFGNIHEVKGGRLAWGVFYENGTGNYRTWNTFNNEMFRGDGSLLYNGGGAAVRLTKDSGMYYEASLRAGTLSSSMSNAVKDGNGNSYGFDSDSTYWGAHVGAGKLIQRGSGQWDIYGKYFHTDIDGDSFEMGGDRFSFDSVTSDRLRLGARYTADTDKAWSLYCGAAYEYEFSGDSHMKAGQFEAPEQSLQGSTVFGEIGTVWGRKDSPWSMDINLRGYAGEREGFSGMVQLAYAF